MTTHPHHTFTPSPWRRIFWSFFLVAAAVALIAAVASSRANQGSVRLSPAVPANIIVVTNTNDSGPGSLRDALAIANDGDTIDATGVSGTVLLTSGELQITHDITINGPDAGNLAVNGNATFRVFANFASDVTISGFTITNGFAADNNGGGGILNHAGLTLANSSVSDSATPDGNNQQGGGIFNDAGATLTVTGGTLTGNRAGCVGGGIYSSNAQLTVINSTLSGNGAGGGIGPACSGSGGGIFYSGGGSVTVTNSIISGNGAGSGGGIGSFLPGGTTATVTDSTISGNRVSANCQNCAAGGGIFNYGQTLTLTNTTVSDNGANWGGGVFNGGKAASLNVINSTLSGNSVWGGGGGISNSANLTVTNSTLSGNSAAPYGGGGIWNIGTAQIGNTVLNAGEFGGTILNDGGTVTSLGYNLASDDGGGVLTGLGDQINTDPMLGALQDNGGPTLTHRPLPGSPAIDAGDPNFTPPPFYDQRGPGFDRVVKGRIDVGSFEVQTGKPPPPSPTPTPTATATPSATATPTPTATPKPNPTPRPRPTPHPRPSRNDSQ